MIADMVVKIALDWNSMAPLLGTLVLIALIKRKSNQ